MLIIRADGGREIGAGHMMRCLTIADEWPEKDKVLFLCAGEESRELVAARGYRCQVLDSDYRQMEGELTAWEQLVGLADQPAEERVILVDSYYVTQKYIAGLRSYGRVAYLDDLGETPYPADMVINYNVYARPEQYEALYRNTTVKLYIGGRYAPVRARFRQQRTRTETAVKDLLITTGGGDQDNIAEKILAAIYRQDICFHVVSGNYNPYYESLRSWEEQTDNVRIYKNVKDMAALMAGCDLAVSAGGSTVYELAVLGVPFVCFSYAGNQEALTEYLRDQGVAGYGGAYHKQPAETIAGIKRQCRKLLEQPETRSRFAGRGKELIDGLGAGRLAQILYDITV